MIWEYIQNQILGMKWLNELIGNVLAMMGLDINTRAVSYTHLTLPTTERV